MPSDKLLGHLTKSMRANSETRRLHGIEPNNLRGYRMPANGYLIIEYGPQLLDNEDFNPVRMDGHYSDKADAEEIAQRWAEESKLKQSRIVVVEVVAETKQPDGWKR